MAVIRKFLDLSTAHLKVVTRDWLDATVDPQIADRLYDGPTTSPLFFAPTAYGYILYAEGELEPVQLPEEHRYILDIITHAQANGCAYILFDRDADTDDELPVYEEVADEVSLAA